MNTDPRDLCAKCKHERRKHRPDCSHVTSAGIATFCRCKAFKEPKPETAARPILDVPVRKDYRTEGEFALALTQAPSTFSPHPDQLQMEIPGAEEADTEAERQRAALVLQLAEKQEARRAERAFNAPDGPLFDMFSRG